jgi:formylglycine-generating enzyme required for sulfatase activity
VVALGAIAVAEGCRLFVDLDGLQGGAPTDGGGPDAMDAGVDAPPDAPSSDAPPDAPGDAAADASDGGCGRFTTGTPMIKVDGFCIDKTEVTNAQYAAFLAAKGADISGQPSECAWNATYNPSVMCPLDNLGKANYPVNGVDWCDAVAYCKWAGKRLCGKVGGGGLVATTQSPLNDYQQSEWMAACSKNGASIYPYGGITFDGAKCAGGERGGSATTVPVGSFPGCEGGFPGLFDMAGNIHEWENACFAYDGGAADHCWFRGGSYHDLGDTCVTSYDTQRDYVDGLCDIGLRCCADP